MRCIWLFDNADVLTLSWWQGLDLKSQDCRIELPGQSINFLIFLGETLPEERKGDAGPGIYRRLRTPSLR